MVPTGIYLVNRGHNPVHRVCRILFRAVLGFIIRLIARAERGWYAQPAFAEWICLAQIALISGCRLIALWP
jgi:hypothetical protein